MGHPFYNALLRKVKQPVFDLGEWDLKPGAIELRPAPTMYDQTIIGGVIFEPVPKVPAGNSGVRGRARELYGVLDSPLVAQERDEVIHGRVFHAETSVHLAGPLRAFHRLRKEHRVSQVV